jgi:hypothetical protein
MASQVIEVLFRNGWRRRAYFGLAKTSPGREHRAAGRFRWGERSQADGRHVDVDRLDLPAAGVGLVPEAGATPVLQKLLPPLLVRQRPRPALQGVEVASVLPHACVRREQREQQVLVEQQTVRLGRD